jgi:predicted hydrocarbon binding protein
MDENTLTLDESQGLLRLGALRHVLMRPETLAEIQKGVEDRLGPKSAEYLYAAGAAWAVALCKRLKKAGDGEAPGDVLLAACDHATRLGWGRWKLQTFAPDARRLAIQVIDSPFAESYGVAEGPVCHLITGAVAGLAESLLGMPVAGTESSCRAAGEPGCLFVAEGQDLAAKDQWNW